MQQITQKLKTGIIKLIEVPIPEPGSGEVLVRNIYSCISPGTESSTVKAARKGYIGKIKERPEQFKQVLEKLKTQGIVQTYRDVMKKLDSYSPLGYSCVGRVIDIAPDVKEFSIGDYVACGGGSACHSEIVSVPENLCVKLSSQTDLKQAAYNSLGAIAIQGIRQADVRLGEICAVIGLGVIGQLTCMLLKVAGIKVIGIDIDPFMVKMAEKHCADVVFLRNEPGIEQKILNETKWLGCDAVIITAATNSLDPINFAGVIARKKGTIVVVGAVPTGFDREPHFYKKELTVKMSCSYGPGRYDSIYEEKGQDYPYAYVRWTEKRNMQAFQDLIASKKIDIGYLTTHVFKLEDVPKAYDMILEKSEPFVGILIEYDTMKSLENWKVPVRPSIIGNRPPNVSIGFIGAGSYAQGYLLPNIPKSNNIILKGVMTRTPSSSRSVAERFGFEYCTSRVEDILENEEINTVFIATRHDSHAKYVKAALQAGKNVYVEKPLCLSMEELQEIRNIYYSIKNTQNTKPLIMVGYNRRFSPLSEIVKKYLSDGPMSIIYRINAGPIPKESWIQDPEVGGGRIIGEVCHFVDYLAFLTESTPISVYAVSVGDTNNLNDTLNISIKYENGSIGAIHYFANGSQSVPKEYIEVYQFGVTAIIDDFKRVSIYSNKKHVDKKYFFQDKGQKNEVKSFLNSILNGNASPIPFEQIYNTSLVTFKILESLHSHEVFCL